MTEKQIQRNKDNSILTRGLTQMGEISSDQTPSNSLSIITESILHCTKILSNRLIELDETLEHVADSLSDIKGEM